MYFGYVGNLAELNELFGGAGRKQMHGAGNKSRPPFDGWLPPGSVVAVKAFIEQDQMRQYLSS
jgi:hypothetical protein